MCNQRKLIYSRALSLATPPLPPSFEMMFHLWIKFTFILCMWALSNTTRREREREKARPRREKTRAEHTWSWGVDSFRTHPQLTTTLLPRFRFESLFESFMKSTKVQCQRNKKKFVRTEQHTGQGESERIRIEQSWEISNFPPARIPPHPLPLLLTTVGCAATLNTIEWNEKLELDGVRKAQWESWHFIYFFWKYNFCFFLLILIAAFSFHRPTPERAAESFFSFLFVLYFSFFRFAGCCWYLFTSFPLLSSLGGYDNNDEKKKEVEKIDTKFSNVSSLAPLRWLSPLSLFLSKRLLILFTRFPH